MPLAGAPRRRLPTVEMYHKKLGIKRIVNATVYAEEYLSNPNWTTQSPKVSGYREGTLLKAEVLEDKREYDLNKHRLLDPKEAKKRGDLQRARDEQKIVTNSPVLREAMIGIKPVDNAWRSMPWFKRRAYVKEQTGTTPSNKAHAEELMEGK